MPCINFTITYSLKNVSSFSKRKHYQTEIVLNEIEGIDIPSLMKNLLSSFSKDLDFLLEYKCEGDLVSERFTLNDNYDYFLIYENVSFEQNYIF